MNNYTIENIFKSTDRYKLFVLKCHQDEISSYVSALQSQTIKSINIGNELAKYIEGLEDFGYLNIDVYDFARRLLDKNKSKINGGGNQVIAIYNIGILMEPALEINAVQLFKEFSKSTSLIIIWDNQFDNPDRLFWPTQSINFFLDFSESPLKKLQYAI